MAGFMDPRNMAALPNQRVPQNQQVVPQQGPQQTMAPANTMAPAVPQQQVPRNVPRETMDPTRALWAGVLMDMGSFISSAGQQPMQGLGPQMMLQAQAFNAQTAQNQQAFEQKQSEKAEEQRRWEAEFQLQKDKMAQTGFSNVQSSFEGANGNRWLISRDGEVKDTGVPFNSGFEYFPQADGSVRAISRISGQPVGFAVLPEEAAQAEVRARELDRKFDALASLPVTEAKTASALTSMDNLLTTVDEAIELVSPWTTGVAGAALGNIPGTPAQTLQKAVVTIKANIGFDRLQRMREESPTGGALGQVAVKELEALQATIANLDPTQAPDVLEKNLRRVSDQYKVWKKSVEAAQAEVREIAGVEQPRTVTGVELVE